MTKAKQSSKSLKPSVQSQLATIRDDARARCGEPFKNLDLHFIASACKTSPFYKGARGLAFESTETPPDCQGDLARVKKYAKRVLACDPEPWRFVTVDGVRKLSALDAFMVAAEIANTIDGTKVDFANLEESGNAEAGWAIFHAQFSNKAVAS